MKRILAFALFAFALAAAFESCRKEEAFTTKGVNLRFSDDTLDFDTIFSQLATHTPSSITLQLRVTNPDENAVKTNIRMEGNIYGVFKLNADGRSGSGTLQQINEVEIRGKDSIFVFVQAYINQLGSNVPFVVADRILFETNGNKQYVDVVTYPQDAHYLRDSILPAGNLNWPNDKPYVIYNSVLIPEGCTLTLAPGTRVHSHTKSSIFVQGTLVVNGTVDNPVIFQGDRLDDEYKEVAGQWIGIRILPRSINNVITGAIIQNGFLGIEADSMPVNTNPNLTLKQTIIRKMSAAGLVGYSSHIKAENCLIYDCGQFTFIGEYGGNYQLTHNTFAAYNTQAGHSLPAFYLSNAPYKDTLGNIAAKYALNYTLINNLITGPENEEDQIYFNSDGNGIFGPVRQIKNNLIRTKLFFNDLVVSTSDISGNQLNKNPLFSDPATGKFDLKGGSPCKGAGLPNGVLFDLKNNARPTVGNPTIGAYELQ